MQDTFRYVFLVVPCFLLALVLNHRFTFTEVGAAGSAGGTAASSTWQLLTAGSAGGQAHAADSSTSLEAY